MKPSHLKTGNTVLYQERGSQPVKKRFIRRIPKDQTQPALCFFEDVDGIVSMLTDALVVNRVRPLKAANA